MLLAFIGAGTVSAQVCPPSVDALPGDLFALDPLRIYLVAADDPNVDCLDATPNWIAISTARNGVLFAMLGDGSVLHAILPTQDAPPAPLTLDPGITFPVDIAVTEAGDVAVLVADNGLGQPAVALVNPRDGTVTPLEPSPLAPVPTGGDPTPVPPINYIGVDAAIPTSIAAAPGGDLLVAQVAVGGQYQIVRIAQDGSQTLHTFSPPNATSPTRLAIDALPSGPAMLISDAGDLVFYDFETGATRRLANVADSSANVDIAVASVRHAYVTCGGLFEVRWDAPGTLSTIDSLPGVSRDLISLAAHRGPVSPNETLVAFDFEDAAVFYSNVHVDTGDADGGGATVVAEQDNGVLQLTAGVTDFEDWAPIGLVIEPGVPRNGIRFECDYQFLNPNSRITCYVNGRVAFDIVAPPDAQLGSPSSAAFAHYQREISLDRLGLLGAPRLVFELWLYTTDSTDGPDPASEVILDNLILTSSNCSQVFGDLNFDTILDLCDVQYLTEFYGQPDVCNDLNQDGYVDAFDFANLLQLVERDYLGECDPPTFLRGGVPIDESTPLSDGNLLIVAKDADWEDWIYEVQLEPLQVLRKFRTPGAASFPPIYTQVRHDGHGVLHAVDFNGLVERWRNSGGQLTWTYLAFALPQPPPVPIQELYPVDVAVTRGNGLWVNYAPAGHGPIVPDTSYLVHYADTLSWLDAYSHGTFTRARTLLTTGVGEVWTVTADRINFTHDILANLAAQPVSLHAITQVDATICTSLMRDQFFLNVGSADGDTISTYCVAGGMQTVSGPPESTNGLPGAMAITGTIENPLTGDVYACGFRAVNEPSPWHMEPRLARIPAAGGPIEMLDLTGLAGDFEMPISITIFQLAPPGDFDADFDIDLHDAAALQRCTGCTTSQCLDDFDFNEDQCIDADDFAAFGWVFSGAAAR